MNIEQTGRIVAILPVQSGQSGRGAWIKNLFVIEWQENGYPQKLCLEVMGEDKFEKMKNAVRINNEVLVRFSVSSREWQGRWFTSCQCFYCSTVGNSTQQPVHTDPSTAVRQGEQAPAPVEPDLPF